MKTQELIQTAKTLTAPGKGILAMDESNPTCGKRLEAVGIPNSEGSRRRYRHLLLSTPGLGDYISGAILYDETIRMDSSDGEPFTALMQRQGIIPGIKVDTGAKDLAGHSGEKVTEGLDGLRERLAEYYAMGARFAKWRAVITIGGGMPTVGCIDANTHALARYAALCQEAGLVPIVEPEVLLDGDHSIERCYQVTEQTLAALFEALRRQRVLLEGLLLKPSMVVPGKGHSDQASIDKVAEMTLRCFYQTVPAAVGGVVFLSGGQSAEQSTAHLDAMNRQTGGQSPWPLTFSYARALQQPALEYWCGDDGKFSKAQQILLHRARCNSAAAQGRYESSLENQQAA